MYNSLFLLVSTFSLLIGAEYLPVSELDLSKYMGRWYQVYKDRLDDTFQGHGTCAVADYSLLKSNVSVLNSQINKDDSVAQISGYAFYLPGNTGGDLTVRLDGVPQSAPYWVLNLGPVVNEQYDYSIVSDDKRLSLFVLARNVSAYYDLYDDTVQQLLYNYGFSSTYNKPVPMDQVDCDYTRYTV